MARSNQENFAYKASELDLQDAVSTAVKASGISKGEWIKDAIRLKLTPTAPTPTQGDYSAQMTYLVDMVGLLKQQNFDLIAMVSKQTLNPVAHTTPIEAVKSVKSVAITNSESLKDVQVGHRLDENWVLNIKQTWKVGSISYNLLKDRNGFYAIAKDCKSANGSQHWMEVVKPLHPWIACIWGSKNDGICNATLFGKNLSALSDPVIQDAFDKGWLLKKNTEYPCLVVGEVVWADDEKMAVTTIKNLYKAKPAAQAYLDSLEPKDTLETIVAPVDAIDALSTPVELQTTEASFNLVVDVVEPSSEVLANVETVGTLESEVAVIQPSVIDEDATEVEPTSISDSDGWITASKKDIQSICHISTPKNVEKLAKDETCDWLRVKTNESGANVYQYRETAAIMEVYPL